MGMRDPPLMTRFAAGGAIQNRKLVPVPRLDYRQWVHSLPSASRGRARGRAGTVDQHGYLSIVAAAEIRCSFSMTVVDTGKMVASFPGMFDCKTTLRV